MPGKYLIITNDADTMGDDKIEAILKEYQKVREDLIGRKLEASELKTFRRDRLKKIKEGTL